MVRRWARAQRARGKDFQPRFTWREVVGSWLGGRLAITILGLISGWSHYGLVVAPFGASTVLLFGHRRSPLAQPRNILLGNTSAFGTHPWVMGLAVGSLLLMELAAAFSRLKGDADPYPHHWL